VAALLISVEFLQPATHLVCSADLQAHGAAAAAATWQHTTQHGANETHHSVK